MLVLRLPAAGLLLTIAAASGSVNAQNTLRLDWTPPTGGTKTCIFTTNSDGVTLESNGALKAAGSFAASDCPSGSVVTPSDPAITNGIDASEIPASTSPNASHSISWAASNADSCNYSESVFPAAVTGWPTTGAACTSATECAAGKNVTVSLPSTTGSYTFALTCTKTGSSTPARSTRTTVVSGPPPAGCIAPTGLTRLTSGKVTYNSGEDRNVDLTLFENVFGHDNQGGPYRAWPGTKNINQRVAIPRNNYVALKFTVPSSFVADTRGQYRFEETAPTASVMSITISKSCGDFSTTPTPPMTSKCILNAGPLSSALTWGRTGLTSRCELEPGGTYYLNIVHANLNTPLTSGCGAGSCTNPIQNQKTNPATNPDVGWLP